MIFKIVRGFIRTSLQIPYSTNQNLRGHMFKLEPGRFNTVNRRHFLTNRVISEWNRLPEHVVAAESVDCFKGRLDKFWSGVKDIYLF